MRYYPKDRNKRWFYTLARPGHRGRPGVRRWASREEATRAMLLSAMAWREDGADVTELPDGRFVITASSDPTDQLVLAVYEDAD